MQMNLQKYFRRIAVYILAFWVFCSGHIAIAHEFNINNYKYRLHDPLRKISEKFKIKIKKEIIKERRLKRRFLVQTNSFQRDRILSRIFPVTSYKVKKIYYSMSGPVIINLKDSLKEKTDAFNTIAAENNLKITKDNIIGYIKDYIYLTHDYNADYTTVLVNEQSIEDIRNAINRNYNMKISFDVNNERETRRFYDYLKYFSGIDIKHKQFLKFEIYLINFNVMYFSDRTLSFYSIECEFFIDSNGIIYPLESDSNKL